MLGFVSTKPTAEFRTAVETIIAESAAKIAELSTGTVTEPMARERRGYECSLAAALKMREDMDRAEVQG